MKATELMVGNWVLINGTPRKIQAVDGVDDEIMADDELYTLAEDRYHSEDKVDGVPITPEILEKNGFECRGAWCLPGEDLGLRQDGDSWGLLSYYVEYDALAFCHIKYVHELQNVISLCGIEKEITI